LDSEGGIWVFGLGEDGQLGLGDENDRNTPTQIPGFKNVIQVNCGGIHTALITLE